jgi:cytidylate kinase
MFRVLTVSREYGSGGPSIARTIAERLGWELLDKALVLEIARVLRVDPELAQDYDERVDSWLHRVGRAGLWHGAFEGVVAAPPEKFLDAESAVQVARRAIMAAYQRGKCVIVGRGAQCVLQNRADALHVFIYAPWAERVTRIRRRAPEARDIAGLIQGTDRRRAEYIRVYFGCNWSDPHLYHLQISSELGEEQAASVILGILARGAAAQADHPQAFNLHGD